MEEETQYFQQIQYLQSKVGFESFSKFAKTLTESPQCYNDLLLAYRKYLSKLATNNTIDNLIEMCDLCVLPICTECGYYIDETNNSREYYCLLVDNTIIPTLEREFEEDQRFIEYIIDAATEIEIRTQELAGKRDYDRKTIGVTISRNSNSVLPGILPRSPYYNCMMIRYPLEDIKDLPPELFEEITREYIVVHICDREIGKNVRLAPYIISTLTKINKWRK